MSEVRHQSDEDGEVVYRRLPVSDETVKSDGSAPGPSNDGGGKRSFAPTLRPLLVGFLLLLVLIGLLGYISRIELVTVERGTSLFQNQYRDKIKLLLGLHAAVINLESEARIRFAAESRGELRPPFDVRVNNARRVVEEQLAELELMPFANQESWRVLKERIVRSVETTKDLEVFSLEGFAQFRDLDIQIKTIESELRAQPLEVTRRSEALTAQAARRITFWWITSLVIGLLVVAATVWEVQRRFRHELRSLEAARRERQFSTQMLEGMVSAVAAIDARARIRSANAAFFSVFPKTSVGISIYDELSGTEATKLLEAAVSQRVDAADYRGRWTLGAEGLKADSLKTYDFYCTPLEIDGEPGQVVTLVDVSDAVESELKLRRAEALAAVGQASAQVAHEIRNPLGSIGLGVSMIREMIENEEAIKTIDLVERGIDHLNKLVMDVTQFSREKPLTRTQVDLHQLLDSSLELVADRISDKQARIEKRFSSRALQGSWDEDQMRQVFVNLLANAIDAGQKNAQVSITTESRSAVLNADDKASGQREKAGAEQQIARVTVLDEGEGIDEAKRARIFEPFFTTKKRGTGLGLAIVKQIVERHGGTISVESEPGKGARFVVDLPLGPTETETR